MYEVFDIALVSCSEAFASVFYTKHVKIISHCMFTHFNIMTHKPSEIALGFLICTNTEIVR